MNDDELRTGLRSLAAPAQDVLVPALGVIHRRARRRSRRNTLAGAGVVTVLAAAAATVVPLALSAAPHPIPVSRAAQTGWIPPGRLPVPGAGPATAPFFAVLAPNNEPTRIEIYRITSRRQPPRAVATIRPPGVGMRFSGVVAAGDDRTFLLTEIGVGTGNAPPPARYYELRLGPDGQPSRLTPVEIHPPVPPGGYSGDMALTADGTELAIGAGTSRSATIEVVSMLTGQVRTWSGRGMVGAMCWLADRRLAYEWTTPTSPGVSVRVLALGPGGAVQGGPVRAVNLGVSSKVLVPASTTFGRLTAVMSSRLASAGPALFAVMSGWFAPPNGQGHELAIVAFSARTGKPLRVINQSAISGMGAYCGVLWSDASGHDVLTSCGLRAGLTSGQHFTLWGRPGGSFWSAYRDIPVAW